MCTDKAQHPWANAKRTDLVERLHSVARERLTHARALDACDAFTRTIAIEGHHAAVALLAGARDQVFTCLRPQVRRRLARLGGPELGSGVLERVMRELNARTDIGGSRWSVDGLRDLVRVQLVRMTDHPTWTTLRQNLKPDNKITFTAKTATFNAA